MYCQQEHVSYQQILGFYRSAMDSSEEVSHGDPGPDVGVNAASLDLWRRRMRQIDVVEADIHQAILNYFVVNGNQAAAQAFVDETYLTDSATFPLAKIGKRSDIRVALYAGDVHEAVRLLNELSPQILGSHPDIHFALLCRLFVQKIENNNLSEAILFSQEEYFNKCSVNTDCWFFVKEVF